jgi:hypothetical protein
MLTLTLKKSWIAKEIFYLNYDSVLVLTDYNHHDGNKRNSSSDDNITYRDLTQREIDAYRNALSRIMNEESITKSKGRTSIKVSNYESSANGCILRRRTL